MATAELTAAVALPNVAKNPSPVNLSCVHVVQFLWALRGSNPRPSPCKGDALPN